MSRRLLLLFFLGLISELSAMEQEIIPSAVIETSPLRVMTYNIRRKGAEKAEERKWELRLPMIKKHIDQSRPHIMGLQEAVKEQIADLEKELPHMKQFGEGRGKRWGFIGEDEYNPIFYDPERVKLIEYGTFSLDDPAINPINFLTGTSRGPLPRIATWGKFKDMQSNKEFYAYNTHLDHWYNNARVLQLGKVKKAIDQAEPIPVILMGDFNEEFERNIKDSIPLFVDVRELAQKKSGPDATRTGWTDDELKRIDHILINKPSEVDVVSYSVLEETKPYSSDHRPVMAEVQVT